MVDTGFSVPDDKVGPARGELRKELAQGARPDRRSPHERVTATQPTFLSGGGGLVSTAPDYLRFCQMLANRGELHGRRVLGRKTVELMTTNHLPGGGDLAGFALPGGYGEVGFDGMGFGLTMAVGLGPARTQVVGPQGSSCGAARRRRRSSSIRPRSCSSCS